MARAQAAQEWSSLAKCRRTLPSPSLFVIVPGLPKAAYGAVVAVQPMCDYPQTEFLDN